MPKKDILNNIFNKKIDCSEDKCTDSSSSQFTINSQFSAKETDMSDTQEANNFPILIPGAPCSPPQKVIINYGVDGGIIDVGNIIQGDNIILTGNTVGRLVGIGDVVIEAVIPPVDLSNYYTKTELQTSGQSQVHWDNLTNVPSIQSPLTFENGLREDGGVVKLGVDLVGGINGLISEPTVLLYGSALNRTLLSFANEEEIHIGKIVGGDGQRIWFHGQQINNEIHVVDAVNQKGLEEPADYSANKTAYSYVTKMMLDAVANEVPTLQEVTDEGNSTTNIIETSGYNISDPNRPVRIYLDQSSGGLYIQQNRIPAAGSGIQSLIAFNAPANNDIIISNRGPNTSSIGTTIGVTHNGIVRVYTNAGSSTFANVRGADALSDDDFVTKRQLDAAAATIPDLAGYATEQWVLDQNYITGVAWDEITGSQSVIGNAGFNNTANYITLAQVPDQVQTDWLATTGLASILNKPVLTTVATTGDYNDLINQPSIPDLTGYATEAWVTSQGYLTSVAWDFDVNTGDLTIDGTTNNLDGRWLERAEGVITPGYGITVNGDLATGMGIELDTTVVDNRYLRKDINDSNGAFTLTLGGLVSGNAEFTGTVTLWSVATGTTNEILLYGPGGVVQRKTLEFEGSFGIANAAGTREFAVNLGEDFLVEGTGDTVVSFNSSTRKLTINSVPGQGGGGVITSVFGRTGPAILAVAGDYNTSQVTESTNLYFTAARVRATQLSNYVVGPNAAISTSDHILQAFGKAQGQINARVPTSRTISISGTSGNISVSGTPTQNLGSNAAWTINLATVGTAGANKTKVTTDAYGRVIASAALTLADLPSTVTQTLTHDPNASFGNISISGGNTINLSSIIRNTSESGTWDSFASGVSSGLKPFASTTGATGFPSVASSGFIVNRNGAGNVAGSMAFGVSATESDVNAYFNVGLTSTTWTGWRAVADKDWADGRFVNTYGNQTGIAGNKTWTGVQYIKSPTENKLRLISTTNTNSLNYLSFYNADDSRSGYIGFGGSAANNGFYFYLDHAAAFRYYTSAGTLSTLDGGGLTVTSQGTGSATYEANSMIYRRAGSGNVWILTGTTTNSIGARIRGDYVGLDGVQMDLMHGGYGAQYGQLMSAGGNIVLGASSANTTVSSATGGGVYLRPTNSSSTTNEAIFGSTITLRALSGSSTQIVTATSSGVLGRMDIPAAQTLTVNNTTTPGYIAISGGNSIRLASLGNLPNKNGSQPDDLEALLQSYITGYRTTATNTGWNGNTVAALRVVRASTESVSYAFDLGMVFNTGKLSYRYTSNGGTSWDNNNVLATEAWVTSQIPTIPTNYVTTDTTQTVSGIKTWTNTQTFSGPLNLIGTNGLTVGSTSGVAYIRPASNTNLASGMYGLYNSEKIGHIWSTGSQFRIADDGSDFGTLYGMAYAHSNNPNAPLSGHQIVFTINGTPATSIGLSNAGIWTIDHGTSSNWINAYNRSINSSSFGTSTGNLILNRQDGGTITTNLDGRYWHGNYLIAESAPSGANTVDANTEYSNGGFVTSYSVGNWLENGPVTSDGYGGLINFASPSLGLDLQFYYRAGHSADANSGLWFRTSYGTSSKAWRSWREVYTDANLTGAATTIVSSNLTTNRALISNGSGKVAISAVTSTELGYLDGVTSNVQTQLGGKFNNPSGTTSQYIRGNGSLATFPTIPTVNNATITVTAGNGLTGGGNFTTNQGSNESFTINVAVGNGLSVAADSVSLTPINAGSGTVGAVRYNGTSRTAGSWYGGTTSPVSTTRLNYDGVIHAYDFVGYGTSDIRLKENIIPITNPLEKLSQLGGYSFKWKEGHDSYKGNDYGLIAQEVEKVLPEIVSERGGIKAIKTGNQLTGLLIAGFNELVKRVEALENGLS